jgi:hypothetical protein
MAVGVIEFLASFVIGLVTSGAIVFGTYIGLQNFQTLPQKLFQTRNLLIYVLFGGFFAFLFQLADTSAFAPLQALAIGATWPAVLLSMTTSNSIRDIGDAQMKEVKDLIDKLSPT